MPKADYTIIRHKDDGYATWGTLFDATGKEMCLTIERPFVDKDNNGVRDTGESRFFPNLYRCFLRKSYLAGGNGKRKYDVPQFENVPDIVAAQIHRATWPWELNGCVALGTEFNKAIKYDGDSVTAGVHTRVTGKSYPGLTGSKVAFEKFMNHWLTLCTQEKRNPLFLWVDVIDKLSAPVGTFA